MATGLNTSLNPNFGIKTVKHGSDNPEGFLTTVEKNPTQGGFPTPTLRTTEQENERNL